MRLLKRYFAWRLGGSLVIVLAAGLLYAQVKRGNYAPATFGQLQQPSHARLTDDSVFQVSEYQLYPPELAEGEGRVETESFCSLCHSTRYITMQPPLPATAWAGITLLALLAVLKSRRRPTLQP